MRYYATLWRLRPVAKRPRCDGGPEDAAAPAPAALDPAANDNDTTTNNTNNTQQQIC